MTTRIDHDAGIILLIGAYGYVVYIYVDQDMMNGFFR